MISSRNVKQKTTTTNQKTQFRVSSTSSLISPPFSERSVSLTTNRTMEEVWKDINLAPIRTQNQNPITTTTCTNNFRNMILQDFLNRPFVTTDPQTHLVSTSSTSSIYGTNSPISSNPTTTLRLNSGQNHFHFLLRHNNNSDSAFSSDSDHLQINPNISNNLVHSSFSNNPFEALGSSSSSGFPNFGKKRYPDSDYKNNGDRRHKRMIKNRESAARSRARKQVSFPLSFEIFYIILHILIFEARTQCFG